MPLCASRGRPPSLDWPWREEFQPLMSAARRPRSAASPGGASSPRGAYCQTVVSKSTSMQSGYSGGSGGDSWWPGVRTSSLQPVELRPRRDFHRVQPHQLESTETQPTASPKASQSQGDRAIRHVTTASSAPEGQCHVPSQKSEALMQACTAGHSVAHRVASHRGAASTHCTSTALCCCCEDWPDRYAGRLSKTTTRDRAASPR